MLAALKPRNTHHHDAGLVAALDRVMAVIEFNPDGTILGANAIFSAITVD